MSYSDYKLGYQSPTNIIRSNMDKDHFQMGSSHSENGQKCWSETEFNAVFNPVLPAASTGAQREKLNNIPYDLVPFQEITNAFVRIAEHGAEKYEPWNWSKGLSRVQLICSLLRHTFAYLRGYERDDGPNGSGLLHTDHILWNAAVLSHNVEWNLEDGRRAEPKRDYKS